MDALIKFYTNDWYFAIPMTLMLLVALALVIWRLLLNQGAGSSTDAMMPDLQLNLRKKGVKAAIALCEQEKGVIPTLLYTAGLQAAEQGVAAMRRSMSSAVELEILPRLNYLLPMILAIAKISTMVGLLGTVISMIGTFSAIGGKDRPRLVRHGDGVGHGHPAGVLPCAVQGVDCQVRDQDETCRTEPDHAGAEREEQPGRRPGRGSRGRS
jgi:hypothetical protein